MAATLFALCICVAQSFAYWGSFDPVLLRNSATITVIDTQIPNVECAMRSNPIIGAIIIQGAAGCADLSDDALIAPITPGPFWLVLGASLITPNQILGHELSHIFRGEFHLPFLSFIERVRRPEVPSGMASSDEHARDVQQSLAPNSRDNGIRVLGAGGTVCVFWTDDKKVSYEDLGSLARACFK